MVSRLISLAALVVLTVAIRAQGPLAVTVSPSSASLSGFVRDESNNPVQATVTIATQGLRQSQLTAADGSFSFSNLKTGMFFACAVPPPGTNGQRYVNSCLWQDRNSVYVPLAPGQIRQNVVVPLQHGYPLHVHVNDPAALLPAPLGKIAGNELAIHVIGPSGLAHPVPIASQDAKGRDHVLVVPYNTPLQLLIHSSSFALKDAGGNALAPTSKTGFAVTQGGQPPAFVVNVSGPKS
ncbi:MAG TPA: carboxypeptidase-like regulatory domain-containing protein [Bryobacteraceae bacterium]|nr:carboxypeptidase-like regulatory domain-containing protein [Bryobacteraceae bacterium]